ncbi:MAG: endolytic transglycosylase MltG [Candidatus Muiribacteriota bacterium]
MKLIIKFFLIFLILFIFSIIYFYVDFNSENKVNYVLQVNRGDNVNSVLNKLKKEYEGVFYIKLLFRVTNTEQMLKPGNYKLEGKYTPKQLYYLLIQGPLVEYKKVTIIPGETKKNLKNKLKKTFQYYDFKKEFINFKKKFPYLQKFNSFEGALPADTFYVNKKSQSVFIEFLELAAGEFEKNYYLEFKDNSTGLNFHQLCTLASVVEREGRSYEEKQMIAGVFLNRLNKNMLLESCATVQYALGEVKPVLTYNDIAIDSIYNTYIYPGLPPGPISFFSKETLKAVVNFKEHDYLYFILKDKGKHCFSKTLNEHNSKKRELKK